MGGTPLPHSPQRTAAQRTEALAAAARWVWCILAIAGCPAEVASRSRANAATLAGMAASHAGPAPSPQPIRRWRKLAVGAVLRRQRCRLCTRATLLHDSKFCRLLERQGMSRSWNPVRCSALQSDHGSLGQEGCPANPPTRHQRRQPECASLQTATSSTAVKGGLEWTLIT